MAALQHKRIILENTLIDVIIFFDKFSTTYISEMLAISKMFFQIENMTKSENFTYFIQKIKFYYKISKIYIFFHLYYIRFIINVDMIQILKEDAINNY